MVEIVISVISLVVVLAGHHIPIIVCVLQGETDVFVVVCCYEIPVGGVPYLSLLVIPTCHQALVVVSEINIVHNAVVICIQCAD